MRFNLLSVLNVRNLSPLKLHCHPHWNMITGPNGAGKTSVLEAIHLLAVGRTFRSRQIKPVIAYNESVLTCYGEAQTPEGDIIPLGIERHRNGEANYKIHAQICERLSTFAAVVPLQLITPETLRLLTAGPLERRRFMDWGVFHVEPLVGATYQRYQQLLKQRNATLKLSRRLTAFDPDLAAAGEIIHQKRAHYLQSLYPFLCDSMKELLPDIQCALTYDPGWGPELSLEGCLGAPLSLLEALETSFGYDQRLGYTRLGPHGADVCFMLGDHPAHQVLSRGQLKLLILALYLAQAQHLKAITGKQCIYLLDDLASELDEHNRQRLLGVIARQEHQVFLTGVDLHSWGSSFNDLAHSVFHVEHGRVGIAYSASLAAL